MATRSGSRDRSSVSRDSRWMCPPIWSSTQWMMESLKLRVMVSMPIYTEITTMSEAMSTEVRLRERRMFLNAIRDKMPCCPKARSLSNSLVPFDRALASHRVMTGASKEPPIKTRKTPAKTAPIAAPGV